MDIKLLTFAFLRSLTAPAKGIEIMAPDLYAFFVTEPFGWKGHRSLQSDPQSKAESPLGSDQAAPGCLQTVLENPTD